MQTRDVACDQSVAVRHPIVNHDVRTCVSDEGNTLRYRIHFPMLDFVATTSILPLFLSRCVTHHSTGCCFAGLAERKPFVVLDLVAHQTSKQIGRGPRASRCGRLLARYVFTPQRAHSASVLERGSV